MNTRRKRLTLPASLVVTLVAAAPVAGCSPSPAPADTGPFVPDVVVSDACMMMPCLQGPITFCGPDDAAVLACPAGANCTAALAADGGLIGTQCYGSCVTSTAADGAAMTGFC
jgi:hypothetical protein